jgi:hypothetical protein
LDCFQVALPVSAPIPQQHWTVASAWIPVFGRDLVDNFTFHLLMAIVTKSLAVYDNHTFELEKWSSFLRILVMKMNVILDHRWRASSLETGNFVRQPYIG